MTHDIVKRIKTTVYVPKYYDLVGREIDAASMTWDIICHFNDHKAIEREYTAPAQIATVTKKLTIMKWVDFLEERVRKNKGFKNIP